MGNDGGTVAKRNDILKLYKQDTVDKDSYVDNFTSVTICKLTNKSLISQPVVSDYQGNLFLKELILQFLILKGYKTNKDFNHIKTMNDVIELNINFDDGKLMCPISKKTNAFIYLRGCGCVMNKQLITNLIDEKVYECPNCNTSFVMEDLVIINGKDDDENLNTKNYHSLQSKHLSHSKRPKKVKSHHTTDDKPRGKRKRSEDESKATTKVDKKLK